MNTIIKFSACFFLCIFCVAFMVRGYGTIVEDKNNDGWEVRRTIASTMTGVKRGAHCESSYDEGRQSWSWNCPFTSALSGVPQNWGGIITFYVQHFGSIFEMLASIVLFFFFLSLLPPCKEDSEKE